MAGADIKELTRRAIKLIRKIQTIQEKNLFRDISLYVRELPKPKRIKKDTDIMNVPFLAGEINSRVKIIEDNMDKLPLELNLLIKRLEDYY